MGRAAATLGRPDAVAAVVAVVEPTPGSRRGDEVSRAARDPDDGGVPTAARVVDRPVAAPSDPLVGVGGAGMSAIASVLAAMGHT